MTRRGRELAAMKEQVMSIAESLLQELEQEARTTRRVLERVPDDRLTWRPHAKARTLGELALHVASVPGGVAQLASTSPAQAPRFVDPSPSNVGEVMRALDESLARARSIVSGMDDGAMQETWRLVDQDRELLAMPRGALLRALMLNHWYHHRGQLTAYLRELDVPIPSIYGPSADEAAFASAASA
jgi:uncharacterized damage-inducible protein DinB